MRLTMMKVCSWRVARVAPLVFAERSMRPKLRCVLCAAIGTLIVPQIAGAASTISQNAAARHGLARGWFAQVASARATGPITHIHHDEGLLVAQTAGGMMTALDAETGRILWALQVGPRNHLSSEAAVNPEYVAVVNGSVLYVLDRASGRLLWQKQLSGSPGAGPALNDNR